MYNHMNVKVQNLPILKFVFYMFVVVLNNINCHQYQLSGLMVFGDLTASRRNFAWDCKYFLGYGIHFGAVVHFRFFQQKDI